MKKKLYILFLSFNFASYAQQVKSTSFIEFNYLYGNSIEHAPKIKTIAQSHPYGFLISWNQKKLDQSEFSRTYNFPDFGFSASYQNFKTTVLGKVYSAYAHYNFYLTHRNSKDQVKLAMAFGLGYSTSPFDKVTNSKNWAIGSSFVGAAYLRLTYSREYLIDKFGLNVGVAFLHYSNASFNTPNLGINTLNMSLGVNYNFDQNLLAPERKLEKTKENHPLRFNMAFRTGFNESLINNSGLHPFYTLSLFGSKKLNYKSIVSFGTDIFFPTFMKDYIEHENINRGTPEETADWKRIGIFVGHELYMNQISVITELGLHVYYPYDYVSILYERFGFRKHFNDHLFADLSLKINMFRAEGLEFGIGYRF